MECHTRARLDRDQRDTCRLVQRWTGRLQSLRAVDLRMDLAERDSESIVFSIWHFTRGFWSRVLDAEAVLP